jgi:ribosome modulation factor
MMATAGVATAESDAKLRESENQKGRAAKHDGLSREACPWSGGLCENWWLEGYDGVITGAMAL